MGKIILMVSLSNHLVVSLSNHCSSYEKHTNPSMPAPDHVALVVRGQAQGRFGF
jgi:hypothetical protein